MLVLEQPVYGGVEIFGVEQFEAVGPTGGVPPGGASFRRLSERRGTGHGERIGPLHFALGPVRQWPLPLANPRRHGCVDIPSKTAMADTDTGNNIPLLLRIGKLRLTCESRVEGFSYRFVASLRAKTRILNEWNLNNINHLLPENR